MPEEIKYAPGKHPKSQANLKSRWKPGQSGNPNGRPKGVRYLTELVRQKIHKACPYAPDKTWGEYLVDRWLGKAVDNPVFFKELMDRLEGKVVQPIEGQITSDVTFTIGKGYADDTSEFRADKQDTE